MFSRVATLLSALSMKMSEGEIFPHTTQALELSELHPPIVFSAMWAKRRCRIVDTLRHIAIKMYEAHRQKDTDSSEVFMSRPPQAPEDTSAADVDDMPHGDGELQMAIRSLT